VVSIVFTGDEFGEGLPTIIKVLQKHQLKASFFFTGKFYREAASRKNILQLQKDKHYLGPHSDKHLLYCDWNKRDSLFVTEDSFATDYNNNINAMKAIGAKPSGNFFIPPYEWWNDSVASWCNKRNIRLFSFTPGTRTNADYTWPALGNAYASSDDIIQSLKRFNARSSAGLNGVILLVHAGTDPRRTDKLYNRLDELLTWLQQSGYSIVRIDKLLD
jgi:peptidoglycan/xylan/chitin deacetylase (PgdA/CDA1 family)